MGININVVGVRMEVDQTWLECVWRSVKRGWSACGGWPKVVGVRVDVGQTWLEYEWKLFNIVGVRVDVGQTWLECMWRLAKRD